jgi:uncharacterized protein YjbI with pentapeptide repeats
MNLSGADLIYVTLSHANLSDTNLSNAVFCPMSALDRNSDGSGANLCRTDLTGASWFHFNATDA